MFDDTEGLDRIRRAMAQLCERACHQRDAMRSFCEVQNYLESHVEPPLAGCGWPARTAAVCAHRSSTPRRVLRAKVFGPEYAETLIKAADGAAASERKAAAAPRP
jgi:hypothetical protein